MKVGYDGNGRQIYAVSRLGGRDRREGRRIKRHAADRTEVLPAA
jgi:hypothetical protein